jgi:probable rRNA maturation factor
MPREGRLPAAGTRLAVTVTAPDGAAVSARGLGGWLATTAPRTARGEVTVALVSDGRMRALNRVFRGKDYPTDVLSFAASAEPRRASPSGSSTYLGDVVIATGVARRQAHGAGHSMSVELRVLALHGLLHLLGYDHQTDKGEMARAEARLRKRAGLRDGLIDRAVRAARGRPSTGRSVARAVRSRR